MSIYIGDGEQRPQAVSAGLMFRPGKSGIIRWEFRRLSNQVIHRHMVEILNTQKLVIRYRCYTDVEKQLITPGGRKSFGCARRIWLDRTARWASRIRTIGTSDHQDIVCLVFEMRHTMVMSGDNSGVSIPRSSKSVTKAWLGALWRSNFN